MAPDDEETEMATMLRSRAVLLPRQEEVPNQLEAEALEPRALRSRRRQLLASPDVGATCMYRQAIEVQNDATTIMV